MSQLEKATDDPDPSPINHHAPQPGPGGDTVSAKEGVVPDEEDGIDDQKSLAADIKQNDEEPGAVNQENREDPVSQNEDLSKAEEKTDGTIAEERGVQEAAVSEVHPASKVQGTEDSSDATNSQEESTTARENASIHALLKRDLHQLTRPERSILYHEGVTRQEEGHMDSALKCYLGAITGLSEGSSFEELPKCLHAIADVYFEQNEYEKAVYFIQAEKMYYETALIDIVSIKKHGDSKPERRQSEEGDDDEEHLKEEPGVESNQDKSDDPDDDLSPDAKKGQEFENLARLCLKEGKLQLALDYCGKATKMYQTVYGEEHPITVAALDLFTVIYANVGKKLYSDAMEKFEKEEETLKSERSHDTRSPDSTAPELRQRFRNNNSKEVNDGNESGTHEDIMHRGELEPTPTEERDDWVMTVLLMLLFFLATVFIVIVISSIYCYNNNRTGYCAQTRGDINYWYMYARHFIHDVRKRFR